jgi:hypothetical protein
MSERFAGRFPGAGTLHKGAIHNCEHILPVTSVKDEPSEKPVTEIDYTILPCHGLFSNPKTD